MTSGSRDRRNSLTSMNDPSDLFHEAAAEPVRQPFPDWARAVLADPRSQEPVSLESYESYRDLDESNRFGLVGSFAYLLPITPAELAALNHFLGWMINLTDKRKTSLTPTQIQFRKLLKRFGAGLAPDSIVADLACNDGEFSHYFAHCRYLAMDIWPLSLASGVRKDQIRFGVVADVRHPPLRPESLDAFVSTATLCHLPTDEIPNAAINLLRFVKPDGRVAMTVPFGVGDRISAQLPTDFELVERDVTGGAWEYFWGRNVSRRIERLIRHLPSDLLQRSTAAVQNRLAGGVAVAGGLFPGKHPHNFDSDWLVIRRRKSSG
jgi:SAM-dependent methyltransferase